MKCLKRTFDRKTKAEKAAESRRSDSAVRWEDKHLQIAILAESDFVDSLSQPFHKVLNYLPLFK